MAKTSQLRWHGERLETDGVDLATIEHLHRYAVAFQLVQGKTVLDIACGEGYGSFLMAQHAKRVIGVDISEEAVKHAGVKYSGQNLSFRQGSADKIPLEDGQVDVVVSFETLEHHDKHDEMLREVKRVLKADGQFIISTPNKLIYSDRTGYKNPFHIKELYFEEFRQLLDRHFRHSRYYGQKLVCGSIVVGTTPEGDFSEYCGDFGGIHEHGRLSDPTFFLCVATDGTPVHLGSSYFDGMDVIFTSLKAAYERSASYRIGRALLRPIHLLKAMLGQ